MLSQELDLQLLNKEDNSKGIKANDYIELDKSICDKVASAFSIPLDVFYGTKTEKSTGTNDFITTAVEPILKIIQDGLNDTLVGEKNFIKGERIVFDTFNMKHSDITDVASSLEKLVGIGFSHDDIRGFLNMPLINEPWAQEHNITKNFGKVKGGANEDGE